MTDHDKTLDQDESDPGVLWAEIHRLRAALQGPDGYATWQEAATAERVRRVKAEQNASAPSPQAGAAAVPTASFAALGAGRGLVDLRAVETIIPRGEYPDECTLVMKSGERHSVGSGYNKTALDSAKHWAELVLAATPSPAPAPAAAQAGVVAVRPYEPTEAMEWAAKRIDPALQVTDIRALWRTMWSAYRPAPAESVGAQRKVADLLRGLPVQKAHDMDGHCDVVLMADIQERFCAPAEAVGAQRAEVQPVEVWHGDRKVTVYPGERVLRVAGVNDITDEPFSLKAVGDAFDWLYEQAEVRGLTAGWWMFDSAGKRLGDPHLTNAFSKRAGVVGIVQAARELNDSFGITPPPTTTGAQGEKG